MTSQTTAGVEKAAGASTEFWRPAKSHAAMTHPKATLTQRVPQPRPWCIYAKGCSPDVRLPAGHRPGDQR
jgi:hypothetical protein